MEQEGHELLLPLIDEENICLPLPINVVSKYWNIELPMAEAIETAKKYSEFKSYIAATFNRRRLRSGGHRHPAARCGSRGRDAHGAADRDLGHCGSTAAVHGALSRPGPRDRFAVVPG